MTLGALRRWGSVVGNRQVARATWWLEVASPEIAAASQPGQFAMVGFGTDQVGAPFLPRPFSIAWRSVEGVLGLLVRVFGAGSRRLAELRDGDELLLLGPLGHSFRLAPAERTTCVAGGVGLAPFLFLAAEAERRGSGCRLLYGERGADSVFDPDWIERLTGGSAEIWTEDGSMGRQGRVVDGVGADDGSTLLGCGPTPMLRALARLADDSGRELQVSVEEHMGCGIGTCQGCVVRGSDGEWIRSCTEGPVLLASRLAW